MATGIDPLKGQDALTRSMWERLTATAEEYNQPGVFTALIGFEWTSSPGGNNLHRNVIFRDDKNKADQVRPMSNYDSVDPEDLWEFMRNYESMTGGKAFAIAHNGNLSNGLMFELLRQSHACRALWRTGSIRRDDYRIFSGTRWP